MVAVERWKVHSTMLEFTIKKAVSTNFLSLIHEDKLQKNTHGRVRRLSVQSTPKDGYSGVEKIVLSSLRLLRIFDTGFMDFRSCRMMRVMDLEGCSWLKKTDVDAICGLVFLKYLSLRNTSITTLPKEIKKFKCLETLDIRETGVTKLPIEVIFLPMLASLFGKFEVPQLGQNDTESLEKFLKKESKLHTLAGVVINGTQSFETIILHSRRLKKVKIWFRSVFLVKRSLKHKVAAFLRHGKPAGSISEATNSTLAGTFVSSLQKRFDALESVSIDLTGISNDFLGSLHPACIISSIKLWGKLESLPEPDVLSQLGNLRKLHLFSVGLNIAVLAILQNLQYLEYLKLVEDKNGSWNGKFVVKKDGFPSLHLLCLEAPKLPDVTFEQGSMASLNSLQLLCLGSPAKAENISHLAKLNEVILHHSAPDSTVKAYKDAAKLHANKPYVKKQPEPKCNAP